MKHLGIDLTKKVKYLCIGQKISERLKRQILLMG